MVNMNNLIVEEHKIIKGFMVKKIDQKKINASK